MTEILVILCLSLVADFLFSRIGSKPPRALEFGYTSNNHDLKPLDCETTKRVRREFKELHRGPRDDGEIRILEYAKADFTPLFNTGCFLIEGCLTAKEVRKLNNLPPMADGESRGTYA